MEWITQFAGLILHLDQHLLEFAQNYGNWIYGLLFLIVFCETGLVVTPFLPGDSLLFVAGLVARTGALNVHLMVILLVIAAVIGDSLNFAIGRWLGPKVFRFEDSWFFKKSYVQKAHEFYERHGGKTIIIARFLPIIRTYAPFVAGIANMDYGKFIMYNVVGAVLWVALLAYAGFFFGGLPFIKNNLTLVIVAIIIISLMPGIIEYWRNRRPKGA